ncbi:MAG: UDP-3-O-(3-hydroxymyristoyl)glucosamine N-acyltransferase [Deltaproteobacteria bacterium]|nr:UDP-3-O-(3-hydroxymyristoyl)glucosamine N-acyltransferase [Deltaproteobacteria bacterium]MBI3016427.1 UDP-3-O-(3-hydroxymyristoyl)glucosamine N-acyltransferase [Deltaproteobacteria bacterium]
MTKSIREIASTLEAEVYPSKNIDNSIEGAASFEKATEKELTFITHLSMLEKTKALVVICPKELQPEKLQEELKTNKTLLFVKNPKLAFAKTLELLDRPQEVQPGISSEAWVDEGAEIDPTATVYPFVSIRKGAKVGKNVILYPGVYVGQDTLIHEDCIIFPNVTLLPKTTLGKRVIIHSGSVIGDDGFGYVWDETTHYKTPQIGCVIIEDDVEIGANTCIDRATTGETKIQRGTKIDNLVQIGHNVEVGAHCILCGQVGIAGSSKIGHGSILGGQTGVADHTDVAPMNKIAGQSGVTANTKANETLMGFPAIPAHEYLKIVALWKHLPEMQKTIKKLEKEIEELKKSK